MENGVSELKAKQQTFCEEYLVDLNGAQAAIRAGYSEKTARTIASELLTKPNIQDCIQQLMDKRSKSTEITAERVLQEIAKLGFANMQDYTRTSDGALVTDMSAVTRDQMAAVQEFTSETRTERGDEGSTGDNVEKFRFKLADKRASLDLLGRHLKLFTDKVEHSGKVDLSDLSEDQIDARIEALVNAGRP